MAQRIHVFEFFRDSEILPAATVSSTFLKDRWEGFHRVGLMVGFVPEPPPDVLVFTFKFIGIGDAMQTFRI